MGKAGNLAWDDGDDRVPDLLELTRAATGGIYDTSATEVGLSAFACPWHGFHDYLPDPVSCVRFYRCFKGRRFSFLCPRGTYFDVVHNTCDFQGKVKSCGPDGTRLSEGEGRVTSRGASSTNSVEFDLSRELSKKDEREYMSELPPYSPSSSLCPQSDGLFSHPLSCSKFVYCSRGTPLVVTCPSDLLYNANSMTCDHAKNTVCLRYDK
ncbi:uncharacterized protein LOC143302175 [Babylonia areolata]|uniref:uncharacterized protein LOC143302175 n=1 Tax=Babylonia areolata TaxID=304850 RepID=UPI003FD609D6